MNSHPIPWKHLRNILVLFAPLWIGSMVFFGFAGALYALFSSDTFVARQPLVVRDEAANSADRLGRFSSQTELKAAQETVLEMARNPDVVAAALRKVGPPGGGNRSSWPSASTVESARDDVNVIAPQGSEFGNTEVVYLEVQAKDTERARELCEAMQESLAQQLRHVRQVRADSAIEELTFARDLAARNLRQANRKIREIEIALGTDLGELRSLNDAISGGGTSRRALAEATRELRAAELKLEEMKSLRALLVAGADDPRHLLIGNSELLQSQPSLIRLKGGLIDAQITTSRLSGLYRAAHPRYQAAIASERELRNRMHQETLAAIESSEPKLELQRRRVEKLRKQIATLSQRLDKLAVVRSDYAELDANVKSRTEALSDAEKLLADAQAASSAALETNLVAPLGPPQVNDSPIGPGGTTITLGSTIAGLVFGLGGVFLIAPGPRENRNGRRWSDYLTAGRRKTDQQNQARSPQSGQRATDRPNGGMRATDQKGVSDIAPATPDQEAEATPDHEVEATPDPQAESSQTLPSDVEPEPEPTSELLNTGVADEDQGDAPEESQEEQEEAPADDTDASLSQHDSVEADSPATDSAVDLYDDLDETDLEIPVMEFPVEESAAEESAVEEAEETDGPKRRSEMTISELIAEDADEPSVPPFSSRRDLPSE